jgi:hypothetical protein
MTTHRTANPSRPRLYCWPRGQAASGPIVNNLFGDFLDLSLYVEAFEITKSIHDSTGAWQVSLVPSPGTVGPQRIRDLELLFKTIQLGSIVSLGFDEDGGIMLGIVANRHRTRQRAGDKTSYGLVISGSDMGRLLTQDSIVHANLNQPTLVTFLFELQAALEPDSPLLNAFKGAWGPGVSANNDPTPTFSGSSVKDAIDFALQAAPSMRLPMFGKIWGSTGFPGDFIKTDNSITTWNDAKIYGDGPQNYQGTIWGFLQNLLDEDFYEMWLDTTPTGFPLPDTELIVRPKPFDEPELDFAKTDERTGSEWKELKTRLDQLEHWEIEESEVLSERLGTTDANCYSYYSMTSENELIGTAEASSQGLGYPLVDTYNLRRFGLRDYSSASSLVDGDIYQKVQTQTSTTSETVLEVRELRNRLFNWYRLNSFFEQGEITVHGRDRYRPGDPVFLPWLLPDIGKDPITRLPVRGVRFYCTKVTWRWQFGADYTCTLDLSRGHNDAMIKEAKEIILLDAPVANLKHFAES